MIGLFKADVIHRLGPWTSADAIEWETLNWVDWFNNRRLLDPIGYITRAEAEEAVYANMNACRYSRVRRPKQSPVKPGRFRAVQSCSPDEVAGHLLCCCSLFLKAF